MLSNIDSLRLVPGLSAADPNWLQQLLSAVEQAVKNYTKQKLELATYTEYYSGNGQRDIVLRQFPVINNDTLAVYYDPTGWFGQATNSFTSTTLLTKGAAYVLYVDDTNEDGDAISKRGILRKIAGLGTGLAGWGWGPEIQYPGKLAAYRLPTWPVGDGNLKVIYSAGYDPIPADLVSAVNTLVAWVVRVEPNGAALSSENLGSYSYSLLGRLSQGQIPELMEVAATLRYYREIAF